LACFFARPPGPLLAAEAGHLDMQAFLLVRVPVNED
jgi:hypothetical protein